MSRGDHKLPPKDLSTRPLALVPKQGKYFRCAGIGRPLVDWDERPTSRFSSPGYPVLYLATHWQTAFFEVFGDDLNDMIPEDRAIALTHLEQRQWVEFEIKDSLQSFDVTNAPSQRAIGADGSTFRAPYNITQPWALALRRHPAGVEALEYVSRLNDPRLCLAVFGSPDLIMRKDALFSAKAGLRLCDDPHFLFWLLNEAKIAVKS